MPFDLGGFIQNAVRFPVQSKQMIGDDDAGCERGGARSESLAERNIIVDFERDRRKGVVDIGGHGQRGAPDQIVVAG